MDTITMMYDGQETTFVTVETQDNYGEPIFFYVKSDEIDSGDYDLYYLNYDDIMIHCGHRDQSHWNIDWDA